MNICTQNQNSVTKPHERRLLDDYIRSMVRREFLLLYLDASTDVVRNEEVLLQQHWKSLRKWAQPYNAADVAIRRKIVNHLTGILIGMAREFPEVPRASKTIVIHRLLTKGFPGLFAEEQDQVAA